MYIQYIFTIGECKQNTGIFVVLMTVYTKRETNKGLLL